MPKSYKITLTDKFALGPNLDEPMNLTKQMYLQETVAGPETTIRRTGAVSAVLDFQTYTIDHEYAIRMQGRLYEDGTKFGRFIAQSKIMGYQNDENSLLLLCGKKADILDFCRRTTDITQIDLRTIQVDMALLQEKLPEVNGVWFHCRKGYIRAKCFVGNNIQDTSDFKRAKAEGDISTLSFYFEDPRDSSLHPIIITEDGAVVLQGNYQTVEAEIAFVMEVKRTLLDGLYQVISVRKARGSLGK